MSKPAKTSKAAKGVKRPKLDGDGESETDQAGANARSTFLCPGCKECFVNLKRHLQTCSEATARFGSDVNGVIFLNEDAINSMVKAVQDRVKRLRARQQIKFSYLVEKLGKTEFVSLDKVKHFIQNDLEIDVKDDIVILPTTPTPTRQTTRPANRQQSPTSTSRAAIEVASDSDANQETPSGSVAMEVDSELAATPVPIKSSTPKNLFASTPGSSPGDTDGSYPDDVDKTDLAIITDSGVTIDGNARTSVRQKLTELELDLLCGDGEHFLEKFEEYFTQVMSRTPNNMKNQMVHIQRIAHYIQSRQKLGVDKIVLETFTQPELLNDYLVKLGESGMTPATIKNYRNAFSNAIVFVTSGNYRNIYQHRRDLYDTLIHVLTQIKSHQSGTYRAIAKDRTHKNFERLTTDDPEPPFWFLRIFEDIGLKQKIDAILKKSDGLSVVEQTLIIRFCVATIIARKGHRPGVAQNFRQVEFNNAKPVCNEQKETLGYVYYVEKHKTGYKQPAFFFLSEKESYVLQFYQKIVRPPLHRIWLANNPSTNKEEVVFYNTSGRPLPECTKEINRFYTMNGYNAITPTEIRKQYDSALNRIKNGEEEEQMALLLAHDVSTAVKHYTFPSPHQIYNMDRLLKKISFCSGVLPEFQNWVVQNIRSTAEITIRSTAEEVTGPPQQQDPGLPNLSVTSEQETNQKDQILCKVLAQHPTDSYKTAIPTDADIKTIAGGETTAAERNKVLQRWLYRRRKDQIALLVSALKTVPGRREIEVYIERNTHNGWISMPEKMALKVIKLCGEKKDEMKRPQMGDIDRAKAIALDNAAHDNHNNHWPLIEIYQAGDAGRGIRAKKTIRKGEYVCSYGYRKDMDVKKGEAYINSKNEKRRAKIEKYLLQVRHPLQNAEWYFFADRDDGPKVTYGRLINHSSTCANVKLSVHCDPCCARRVLILFVAKRDIEPGEQILWNYGAKYTDQAWFNICPCASCNQEEDDSSLLASAADDKSTDENPKAGTSSSKE